MILYPKFYKACGVRLPRHLKSPVIRKLTDFSLPKGSYFHFTDQDPDEVAVGIDPSNPFIQNLEKSSAVVCYHDTNYTESIDVTAFRVVRQTMQKPLLVKEWHRNNPKFVKGWIDTSKANLLQNVAVKNHSLVGAEYNYVSTVLSEYNRLKNYWKSVFIDISKTVLTNQRQHFVAIEFPKVIPSRSLLRKWETENKEVNWKKFNSTERFLFTEVYAWLKGDVDTVLPNEPKVLERLNIIFYYKSYYYVVNLGQLKKWIIPEEGKTSVEQQVSIDDIRKFFILGAMKLVMDSASVVNTEIDIEDVDQQEEDNEEEQSDIENVDTSVDDEDEIDLLDTADTNRRELFLTKKNNLKDNSKHTITTVEELLKIGADRNAAMDKKGKKGRGKAEEENIFNFEDDDVNEDAQDESNLELLEEINEDEDRQIEKVEILKETGYKPYQAIEVDLTTSINDKVDQMALSGQYTTAELKRFKNIGGKWEGIVDPSGSGKKAPELIKISQAELVIPEENPIAKEMKGVLDKSMLSSSLDIMNDKYVREILPRHMISTGINLQRNGVCVTDYKVQKVENAFDAYEIHSFKLIPLEGNESTIKVKVPVIDEDGNFIASSVKSRMRLQRRDLPIRKINYREVALTSYVSKFFVTRSELSAYSQERWLEKQLIGLSNERTDVTINFADVYKPNTMAPLKFTILARLVDKIVIGDYEFNFDVDKHNNIYGKELVDQMNSAKKNQIVVGKNTKKDSILIMASDGDIFEAATDKQNEIKNLGSIEHILGFQIDKSPVDMASINLFSKNLPLGFILGYYLGLGNLIETVKAKVRRVPKGARTNLEDHEFAIRFADETLVFERTDYKAALLFGGFRQIKDEVKQYSVYQFDDKEVYGSVLLDLKITARFLKGIDTYRDLWIDPVTRDVLVEMGEPTDFIELLFSALDKLVIDKHDETRDEKGFRLVGYERFAGFAYAEMVKAVLQHNYKPSKANSKIELNPQAVWMSILQDQTTAPVEDSNPIHHLKESEVVVYRGQGGRDGRTLNSESRKYHENSIGILSDATVDNGDAGTVVYLTADPNIQSVLGIPRVVDKDKRKDLPPTKVLNTTSLLAPGIEFDD